MNRVPVFEDGTKQLLAVAGLPLVDGVFATLLATNSITGLSRIFTVAVTIFAGAGSLAVLFSNSDSRRKAQKMVLKASPFLLAGGAFVGLVAPVFSEIFYVSRLQIVSSGVLLFIAGKLARLGFTEDLSVLWILLPGLAFSFRGFYGLSLGFELVLPALQVVSVSLASLYFFSFLCGIEVNLSALRKASALVLVLLSASVLGVPVPSYAGLTVFSVSFLACVLQPRFRSAEIFSPAFLYRFRNF